MLNRHPSELLKLKKILCVLEHREELELAFITDGN
jgi:hypothetical protein